MEILEFLHVGVQYIYASVYFITIEYLKGIIQLLLKIEKGGKSKTLGGSYPFLRDMHSSQSPTHSDCKSSTQKRLGIKSNQVDQLSTEYLSQSPLKTGLIIDPSPTHSLESTLISQPSFYSSPTIHYIQVGMLDCICGKHSSLLDYPFPIDLYYEPVPLDQLDIAFSEAIHKNDVVAVRLLLACPWLKSGNSALIIACTLGDWELVHLLLDHPLVYLASLDEPLQAAVVAGQDAIVNLLLNEPRSRFDALQESAARLVNQPLAIPIESHQSLWSPGHPLYPDWTGQDQVIWFAIVQALKPYSLYFQECHPFYTKVNAFEDQALQLCAARGHVEFVQWLLLQPNVDPSTVNNFAIRWASRQGYTEIVKLLLNHPKVDVWAESGFAMRWACINGHVQVVQLLFATDFSDQDGYYWFYLAIEKSNAQVVELFLQAPWVDPSRHANKALRLACERGQADIVRLLLKDPRVDPNARFNEALRTATKLKHVRVRDLLLCDSRTRERKWYQFWL